MSSCTGREIMTEILGHLRLEEHASQNTGNLQLHSVHDALHYQPVSASIKVTAPRSSRSAQGISPLSDNSANFQTM